MQYGSPNVPYSEVYRERAVACRSMAELCRCQKTRDHLLSVAAEYDLMATQATKFELQETAPGKPQINHVRSRDDVALE
jgi:hypothetical protein